MIEGYQQRHCTLMSVMYDRGISIASLYANESVMCDRGRSVASLYANEKYKGVMSIGVGIGSVMSIVLVSGSSDWYRE